VTDMAVHEDKHSHMKLAPRHPIAGALGPRAVNADQHRRPAAEKGWASKTSARISSAVAVQTKGMASVFQWVRRNASHSMLGS
jgi:hypothetical protein